MQILLNPRMIREEAKLSFIPFMDIKQKSISIPIPINHSYFDPIGHKFGEGKFE
jgi:hypothetical protein